VALFPAKRTVLPLMLGLAAKVVKVLPPPLGTGVFRSATAPTAPPSES
jgi:hypothetical protein